MAFKSYYREKIKGMEEIGEIVKRARQETPSIKIVTTNGAFDILHAAHIYSIEIAKSYGDMLIVGLNSDSSIKIYKSKDRPIIPQKERAELIASLGLVDYVTIFDETDPREFLKRVKPDFHVKSKSGFKGIEREVVEVNGGQIILLDDIKGMSTSDIIERIKRLG
jgi:rfaE bifunctional protein nucleotidyltransferase chain/domain